MDNKVKLNDELLDKVSGGWEEQEGKKHDEEIDVMECSFSPNGHHDFCIFEGDIFDKKNYSCRWCHGSRLF